MDEIIVFHEQIEALIEEKRFKELKELLVRANAIDVAEALNGLSEKDLMLAFRLLDKDQAAEAFVEMEHDERRCGRYHRRNAGKRRCPYNKERGQTNAQSYQ